MNYKKALKELLEEGQRIGSSKGYIWAQTKTAERKITNIPFVNNLRGIDYLQVDIVINTPEHKKYTITGQAIGDEKKGGLNNER